MYAAIILLVLAYLRSDLNVLPMSTPTSKIGALSPKGAAAEGILEEVPLTTNAAIPREPVPLDQRL